MRCTGLLALDLAVTTADKGRIVTGGAGGGRQWQEGILGGGRYFWVGEGRAAGSGLGKGWDWQHTLYPNSYSGLGSPMWTGTDLSRHTGQAGVLHGIRGKMFPYLR